MCLETDGSEISEGRSLHLDSAVLQVKRRWPLRNRRASPCIDLLLKRCSQYQTAFLSPGIIAICKSLEAQGASSALDRNFFVKEVCDETKNRSG